MKSFDDIFELLISVKKLKDFDNGLLKSLIEESLGETSKLKDKIDATKVVISLLSLLENKDTNEEEFEEKELAIGFKLPPCEELTNEISKS